MAKLKFKGPVSVEVNDLNGVTRLKFAAGEHEVSDEAREVLDHYAPGSYTVVAVDPKGK